MKSTFNENDIRNREKKNKVGRFFLWLGLFISLISTLIVVGVLIANSLGLSPTNLFGFIA